MTTNRWRWWRTFAAWLLGALAVLAAAAGQYARLPR